MRANSTDDLLKDASTFGEVVRTLRIKQGLTLRQLASEVGVSAPFLSDVEHGRRSTEKLAELAKALRVDLAVLKKFDSRLSPDLKKWIASNPDIKQQLESYRESGAPVEKLMQALRAANRRSKS